MNTNKKTTIAPGVLQKAIILGSLILIIIIFSLLSPNFLTLSNIGGILLATTVNGILSIGITYDGGLCHNFSSSRSTQRTAWDSGGNSCRHCQRIHDRQMQGSPFYPDTGHDDDM